MSRRTDVELLVSQCAKLGGTWGTRASVTRRMVDHGWPEARALRAVERAISGEVVKVGRGGTLKYSGADVAIYQDVGRRIESSWAPARGLRHVCVHRTSSAKGARGDGNWLYPDLVVLADPARRRALDDGRLLHTIEVETRAGFTIESVYQAHEQGRGADFAWVFFLTPVGHTGKDVSRIIWANRKLAHPSSDSTAVVERRLRRIARAANEIGVGLVAMSDPHRVSTWVTVMDAKRRQADVRDRSAVLKAVRIAEGHLHDRLMRTHRKP